MPNPVLGGALLAGTGRWRRIGGCLALALALGLPTGPVALAQPVRNGSSVLPALGDGAGEDLGVGEERRLGQRIMQEVRRDPDLFRDALLEEYVHGLFDPLLRAGQARGDVPEDLARQFAWETFLVRDRSINAFALPGGYIGVHLGLIAMTRSADELASVLAHEMSHVSQRHIARMLSVNRRQSALGVVAMILGVLAASRSNVDAANAVILGGQAAAAQGQLNFSRDMEREADRVGFGVLEQAGFDPAGMALMFERMQQANRMNDFNQYPYLRSHPLTTERVAEARARLGLQADRKTAGARPASARESMWLHAAMQGRAQGWMDARNPSLQRLLDGLAGAESSAARSGPGSADPQWLAQAIAAAVAAVRLQDPARAEAALRLARRLAEGMPAVERAVTLLQVEVMLEQRRAREALAVLALSPGEESRPFLLLGSRAVLAASGPSAELSTQAERMRTWVALHPDDAAAWEALGQLEARLGRRLAAWRAQAEARFALGDWNGALEQLRAASRFARQSGQGDSIDAVVIDARLKVVDERRRRQLREEGRNPDDPRENGSQR